jgi:hypothetical protein
MLNLKTLFQEVTLCTLLIVVLFPATTEALGFRLWTPERILKKADLLVVGEVYEVTEVAQVAKEMTRWKIPLLRMNAKVRVKRLLAVSGKYEIGTTEPITLTYYAIDWETRGGVGNGPNFPALSIGDIYVLPLKRSSSQQKNPWELIGEEGYNLLTPAATEVPEQHGQTKTGIVFLRSELAGAFSRGRYETVYEAANYLSRLRVWDRQFKETYELIEKHVADDQDRWLNIAVACYSAMGVPRPKIADLLKSGEHQRLPAILAAKALGHIRTDDLEDRFIDLSVKQLNVHTWGTAVTISINYSQHPTAIKLLGRALKDGSPEAVYVARYIIKDSDHPLVHVAADAARKVLVQPGKPDFSNFRAACELIRDYGDERAFALLLDQIRKSQKADRERYIMLWQSCAHGKSQRMLPICEILINDKQSFSNDLRFCDYAVARLQHATGEDFGYRSEQTEAERKSAIEKAKVYLEQRGKTTNR